MTDNSTKLTNSLDNDTLKNIELKLLLSFHELCIKKGWHYSLTAGTLIGAIRHKGFIPWDDDIDVMMPRNDYNEFLKYCRSHDSLPFRFISCENDIAYCSLFGKISDKRTMIVDDYTDWSKVKMGVNIDVFPIDGLGETLSTAKQNVNKNKFLNSIIIAKNWKRFTLSKTRPLCYEPIRLFFFLVSRLVPIHAVIRKVNSENQILSFKDSKYAGCVCGVYKGKTILQSKDFLDLVDVDFEGHKLKAIRKYDAYLKRSYGDYMKLPKEDERIEHHGIKAYYI